MIYRSAFSIENASPMGSDKKSLTVMVRKRGDDAPRNQIRLHGFPGLPRAARLLRLARLLRFPQPHLCLNSDDPDFRVERQVTLLRPETVDPDMLEEMARQSLGWVSANELIIKTSD
jgi:hypothetical protein